MQAPKARTGSSDMPQKTSPRTPRNAGQQPKTTTASESDSASSGRPASRTSTDRSPKVMERKSPRSPVVERKRPSRVTELETQLAQLQEDLKKTKEQLSLSKTCKVQAQQEAEETKKRLADMAAKLEDSQKQLLELSASEEARLRELHKISQERDHAWESELEVLQKQHSLDSAALSSALNEIQTLKHQLEVNAESEAAHAKENEMAQTELQTIKQEMTEIQSLSENMKMQLKDCKESEAQAHSLLKDTLMQLETAKTTIEMLQSDGLKAQEFFESASAELKESQVRMNSLEEVITQLKGDLFTARDVQEGTDYPDSTSESDELKAEFNFLRSQIKQLKSILEENEIKYQEEKTQTTMEIQLAYELAKMAKSDSSQRESQLEAELKKVKDELEELKARLIDKENELQSVASENEGLHKQISKTNQNQGESEFENELRRIKSDIENLMAILVEKEAQLESVTELNEKLKIEIQQRDCENKQGNTETETAKAAEREALTKLRYVSEEFDKSTRKASRVAVQLEAAQAANSEMEAELNRLRIQSDQWRKAAEAAATILSENHNNGRAMKRSGSLDNVDYKLSMGGKMMNSPYLDDFEDDSPKKKNNNVLKRFGGLWKKGQK